METDTQNNNSQKIKNEQKSFQDIILDVKKNIIYSYIVIYFANGLYGLILLKFFSPSLFMLYVFQIILLFMFLMQSFVFIEYDKQYMEHENKNANKSHDNTKTDDCEQQLVAHNSGTDQTNDANKSHDNTKTDDCEQQVVVAKNKDTEEKSNIDIVYAKLCDMYNSGTLGVFLLYSFPYNMFLNVSIIDTDPVFVNLISCTSVIFGYFVHLINLKHSHEEDPKYKKPSVIIGILLNMFGIILPFIFNTKGNKVGIFGVILTLVVIILRNVSIELVYDTPQDNTKQTGNNNTLDNTNQIVNNDTLDNTNQIVNNDTLDNTNQIVNNDNDNTNQIVNNDNDNTNQIVNNDNDQIANNDTKQSGNEIHHVKYPYSHTFLMTVFRILYLCFFLPFVYIIQVYVFGGFYFNLGNFIGMLSYTVLHAFVFGQLYEYGMTQYLLNGSTLSKNIMTNLSTLFIIATSYIMGVSEFTYIYLVSIVVTISSSIYIIKEISPPKKSN